jgi:hypothetical protein
MSASRTGQSSQTGTGHTSHGDNRTGLYPMVRRARRPFVIQDDDAVAAPAAVVEAAPVVPLVQPQVPVNYSKPQSSQAKHGSERQTKRR